MKQKILFYALLFVSIFAASVGVTVFGEPYLNAYLSPPDKPLTHEQLLKSAEKGDAESQYQMGLDYYRKGEKDPANYSQAVAWYKKAALQGHPSAQNNLGVMYRYGLGVPKDALEAMKWYRLAADKDSLSAYNVGKLYYYKTTGIPQSYPESMKWFQKAQKEGSVGAEYYLGLMYLRGQSVEKNCNTAMTMFKESAERGNRNAQFTLALIYESSKNLIETCNVSFDDTLAFQWYKKAAEQQLPQAEYSLGTLYRYGKGTEKNYFESKKWLLKAADQGLFEAQIALGILYAEAENDYVEGYKWLSVGISRVPPQEMYIHSLVTHKLQSVSTKMTPQQIAEAKKLARDFTPHVIEVFDP